jgi:hypothetical protein
VAFSRESRNSREVWRTAFDFEGLSLGLVQGDVITNARAMSVSIRLDGEQRADRVRKALPRLREELASVPMILQYLGVGSSIRDDGESERRGLDMEI